MSIDVKDSNKDRYKQGTQPIGAVLTGSEPGLGELKIYIDEAALSGIDGYLAADINKELGGVLLGNVYIDPNNERFLLIDGFIHALHTTASVSRLTFTHETWEYINNKIEKEFPEKIILGWYHSHPGHTVFLSSYDVFIQENFFNMDFMTAYVYDPTINERAFFIWKDGKIVRTNGFYVISKDKDFVPPPVEISKIEDTDLSIPEKKTLDRDLEQYLEEGEPVIHKKSNGNILIYILLGLNLILTAFLLFNYMALSKERSKAEEVNKELTGLKDNYKALNQKLENYIIETELKNADTLKSANEITYEVKQGDTIEKISMQFYSDPAKGDTILKHNSIQNTDLLAGRIIIIPSLSNIQK